MNASREQEPGNGDPTPWFYRTAGVLLAPLERMLGIDCRRFTRLASRRMDGPLGLRERLACFVHRLVCVLCRVQDDRTRRLGEVLRLAASQQLFDAGAAMPEDAKERLRQRLRAETSDPGEGNRP